MHPAPDDAASRAGQGTVVFTIVSRNYFHFALNLMASVAEHLPGTRRVVVICDERQGIDSPDPGIELLGIEEVGIAALDAMVVQYSILELNTDVYKRQVFFLLSGFFIALSIRRNAQANGRFDAVDFALARGARLYPPLVGALLLTAACVAALDLLGGAAAAPGAPGWTLKASATEYGGALLFAGGLEGANPVLWSLNFEARLYLLAAMVAWAATRGRWLHPVPLAAAALAVYSVLQTPAFAVYAACLLYTSRCV